VYKIYILAIPIKVSKANERDNFVRHCAAAAVPLNGRIKDPVTIKTPRPLTTHGASALLSAFLYK
jgi:hypothetical protein